jgi:hypothetical protein
MWHYHGRMTCGHAMAWDQRDLMKQASLDTAVRNGMPLPCPFCRTDVPTTSMTLIGEGAGCDVCGPPLTERRTAFGLLEEPPV